MAEKKKPEESPEVKTQARERYEALLRAFGEVQRKLLGEDLGATVAASLNLEHARGLAEAGCALEPELTEAIALAVAEVVALVVDTARAR